MAICDSILSPSLLGCTVTVVESIVGYPIERTGTVIGVLQALPGSRCTASILLDQGRDCDFYDSADIDELIVL